MIDWFSGFSIGAAVAWGWAYMHWSFKHDDLHIKYQRLRAAYMILEGKDPDKWTL